MRYGYAMRGPWALPALFVFAVACGSSHKAATPPVTFGVGVFSVRVAPDTANLSVLGPDGASLLDGIDSSTDVGTPQSLNDDAPPMTGFAVRDLGDHVPRCSTARSRSPTTRPSPGAS